MKLSVFLKANLCHVSNAFFIYQEINSSLLTLYFVLVLVQKVPFLEGFFPLGKEVFILYLWLNYNLLKL